MTRIHITASGKAAPCTATIRDCPRGGSDKHYDSMKEAVLAMRKAEVAASPKMTRPTETPMGNEAQQGLGSEQGILVSAADFTDALEAREITEHDFGRYLHANDHLFLVDALRAKLRENDANKWRGWADADQLTDEDKHHIALREVVIDADKWRDKVEGRLRPSATGEYFIPPVSESATLHQSFIEANRAWLSAHRANTNTYRNHKGEIEMIVSWKNEHGGTEQRTYASGDDIAAERGEARQRVEARVGREQVAAWDAERKTVSIERDSRHRYGGRGEKKAEAAGQGNQAPKELDPAIIEALKLKFLKVKKIPFDESGLSIPELLQMAQRGELG